MRILIVDDELAIRRLIGRMLGKRDCEVVTAPNTSSALEILQSSPLDCLIIDINLGEQADGIEFARKVKAMKPELKILLITGVITEDDYAGRALKYGFDPIMNKGEIGDHLLKWLDKKSN